MASLKKTVITDKLKQAIIDQISAGVLNPGDPVLPINDLSSRYRMSRGSAVKALRELVDEGILTSRRGKGNFVASRQITTVEKNGRIGLTFPVTAVTQREAYSRLIRRITEYVISRGAMLSIYDVLEDRQEPGTEKKFLENLEHEGFRGAAVFATPREPVNRDMFRRMRTRGIKVAVISPYQYSMSEEVAFLFDYRYGGYLIAENAARRGYSQILLQVKGAHVIHTNWIEEGLRYGARQFGQEIRLQQNISGKSPALAANLALAGLPAERRRETAIFARSLSDAIALSEVLKAGPPDTESPGIFTAADVSVQIPEGIALSGLVFPEYDLLRSVMDYLLDDEAAGLPFLRLFRPKYREINIRS